MSQFDKMSMKELGNYLTEKISVLRSAEGGSEARIEIYQIEKAYQRIRKALVFKKLTPAERAGLDEFQELIRLLKLPREG